MKNHENLRITGKGRDMKKAFFTIPVIVLSVLYIFVTLSACNREKQSDMRKGKLTVKEGEDGVEVQSVDGSLSIAGNEKTGRIKMRTEEGKEIELKYRKDKLADGFPTDIPIYSPAEIKMSQTLQGRNAIATLSTKDDAGRVAQFYKDALVQKGWTLGDDLSVGNIILLQGTKENIKLNISIKKTDAATTINLAMSETKQ